MVKNIKTDKNCPVTNPGNCKYLNTPSVCAFVRDDKRCKKSRSKKGNTDAKRI